MVDRYKPRSSGKLKQTEYQTHRERERAGRNYLMERKNTSIEATVRIQWCRRNRKHREPMDWHRICRICRTQRRRSERPAAETLIDAALKKLYVNMYVYKSTDVRFHTGRTKPERGSSSSPCEMRSRGSLLFFAVSLGMYLNFQVSEKKAICLSSVCSYSISCSFSRISRSQRKAIFCLLFVHNQSLFVTSIVCGMCGSQTESTLSSLSRDLIIKETETDRERVARR